MLLVGWLAGKRIRYNYMFFPPFSRLEMHLLLCISFSKSPLVCHLVSSGPLICLE